MLLASVAVIGGLALVAWSADRFVEGSASAARHLGMPPLLIGMVIVGFGTSVPEMVVSVHAALQGNPGIALGNAYGSNISNIALILGLTAIISPVVFRSYVLRIELPILTAVTALAAWQISDGRISRIDSIVLLSIFVSLLGWTILLSVRKKSDVLGEVYDRGFATQVMPIRRAILWIVLGLLLLLLSSRLLVWGAVVIAQGLGVDDLIIGLTVVAVGTSLPELASCLAAVRKGQDDIALGNILGSNLLNTTAVIGVAAAIHPMNVPADVLSRDMPVMGVLTVSLFVIGFGFRGPGRISRIEGIVLVAAYIGYFIYLMTGVLGSR
jgi:cation:H+ antiporter